MSTVTTLVLLSALVLAPAAARGDALRCAVDEYRATPGLTATVTGQVLVVRWDAGGGRQARLRLAIDRGTPTVREIAIRGAAGSWITLASDVVPEFHVVTGLRRITNQQLKPLRQLGIEITQAVVDADKWEAFWDAPLRVPGGGGSASTVPPAAGIAGQPGLPRRPDEVGRAAATFHADRCEVRTNGARLEISFPGVDLGVFSGRLQYTVYRGAALIRQEVIATTAQPSVAYKYDAGLKGIAIDGASRIVWRDVANNWQDYRFGGANNRDPVPLKSANRLVAVERRHGSLTAFPPPHNFFWAREIDTNLGYTWYRKDDASRFAFGVRQAESEADPGSSGRGPADYREDFALYSARPGTAQRMAVYFTVSDRPARPALIAALAFTRGDRYTPLPGYKVLAAHFHDYLVKRLTEAGSLDAMPSDIEAVKAAGVDIFAPIDGGAAGQGQPPSPDEYVANLTRYYEIARRFSDTRFTIMPNVEITDGELPVLMEQIGGHWDVLMSHPVLFSQGRDAGQPLTTTDPRGAVYHIGSADDLMEMIRREHMLAYMPHPRSKGSTHYPDAIKDTARFRDPAFRGIGFRWGMGLDRSEERLCEYRCLPLFDDMNNWVADLPTRPKFIHAISEVYTQAAGDDVYGNTPVNYVKLDRQPALDDWRPIIDSMERGDYFVTSGEVLIPSYVVNGTGSRRTVVADVQWTFPLEMVEIVWGDGQTTGRQVISATGLPPFGRHRFELPFDATGKKWVRFAVWDSAGNGALVQPVKLTNPSRPATSAARH